MCGLVGIAGKITQTEEKLFKTLLVFDTVRGEDSTGIAAVAKLDGEVRLAKQVGNPFELFQDKRYDRALDPVSKVLIGHNRYATTGAVTRDNAHPFEFESLVGAHNGTLQGKCRLLDEKNFKVDSEALYHHIDQQGLDNALSVLEGAWALTWWDKHTNELNFLRNKERTLFLTMSEDHSTLFWASEFWMLDIALMRHGIKRDKIVLLEEDMLHSFNIDDKGGISKPVVRKAASTYVPEYRFQGGQSVVKQVGGNVTPITRGVTVVKKSDNPQQFGKFLQEYVGKKGILFETDKPKMDSHGGVYVPLYDDGNPYADIRCYLKEKHPIYPQSSLRIEVIGDISDICESKSTPGKHYYKVSPYSIKFAPNHRKKDVEHVFHTHTGELVSKKVWEDKYGTCSWCTVSLSAEDSNRFTTGGDCLCPGCASDPEVSQYVNLA